MKQALKWIFKIALIMLAFYLVFKKLSFDEIKATWTELHAVWLVPAFILYNISQFISTFRLLQMLRAIGVEISYINNLTLYYKAMFYGLFLPGGVSGDAYKVIYLQKKSESSYKSLITATLLDRVNGLTMLLTIAVLLLMQKLELVHSYFPITKWWAAVLIVLGWVIYIVLHRKLFPAFNELILKISFLSLTIQILQLISFFCILYGFSIAPEQWLQYGILFYTGSVLAALPLSINGLGIREWVLVTGSSMMALDSAKAFSASLVFTLISGICALIGGMIKMKE